MDFLGKEYKFVKQENFQEFLKFSGVSDDKITGVVKFTPAQKLTKNGDKYTYHTQTPDGAKEITFTPGVEFDDTLGPQKQPVKTMFSLEGNTLTQTVKSDKGVATFVREFSGDEMILTITAQGWDGAAKRYYKAN